MNKITISIVLTLMAIIGLILASSGSEEGMPNTPIFYNILGISLYGFSISMGVLIGRK